MGEPEELHRFLMKQFGAEVEVADSDDAMNLLLETPTGGRHFVIWLRPNPMTTLVANLAHETSHLVDGLFAYADIPPGEESGEVRAYLTAFVVMQGLLMLDTKPKRK